jgi:hypothetical protein
MNNQIVSRSQQYNALSRITQYSVHVKGNEFYNGTDKLELLRAHNAVGYKFKINLSEFGHHIFFNSEEDKIKFQEFLNNQ